jgi:hypothetical protein
MSANTHHPLATGHRRIFADTTRGPAGRQLIQVKALRWFRMSETGRGKLPTTEAASVVLELLAVSRHMRQAGVSSSSRPAAGLSSRAACCADVMTGSRQAVAINASADVGKRLISAPPLAAAAAPLTASLRESDCRDAARRLFGIAIRVPFLQSRVLPREYLGDGSQRLLEL